MEGQMHIEGVFLSQNQENLLHESVIEMNQSSMPDKITYYCLQIVGKADKPG